MILSNIVVITMVCKATNVQVKKKKKRYQTYIKLDTYQDFVKNICFSL